MAASRVGQTRRDSEIRESGRAADETTLRRVCRAFVSPTSQSGFFFCIDVAIVILLFFLFFLGATKATKKRTTEGVCYTGERRFQSKKGRSAPHIPPVVSAGLGATEPLRGSTIRRPSGAQPAAAEERRTFVVPGKAGGNEVGELTAVYGTGKKVSDIGIVWTR
ncbi:hypothetical protein KM043_013641 [Ampulex compressa]|nr:hypothetical protein KM043_013641 [Ampulex compressa]